jgi:hypothetical protein
MDTNCLHLRSGEHRQLPYNKQLQRTVIRRHVRAASASFHYALAARFTRQRAAAELHVMWPDPKEDQRH